MSPMLMEALQLLKFSLKKERLDFMKGWSALEADMVKESWPANNLLGTLLALAGNDLNGAVDNILNTFSSYNSNCD